MNGAHLQNLRYKLQKRVRRLNSAGYEVFHISLKQFWGFLVGNPILLGVMEDLEQRYPQAEVEAEKIVKENQALLFDTEIENVSVAYFVIKKYMESEEQLIEAHIGGSYNDESNFNDMLEYFRSFFLELFYEYLDEYLDDQMVYPHNPSLTNSFSDQLQTQLGPGAPLAPALYKPILESAGVPADWFKFDPGSAAESLDAHRGVLVIGDAHYLDPVPRSYHAFMLTDVVRDDMNFVVGFKGLDSNNAWRENTWPLERVIEAADNAGQWRNVSLHSLRPLRWPHS